MTTRTSSSSPACSSQNDFKMSLMAPEDLREYAGLTTTTITCKQRLTLSAAGIDLIKWALEGTFGSVDELPEMHKGAKQHENGNGVADGDGDKIEEDDVDEEVNQLVAAYMVMDCVAVRYRSNGEVELEWEGNMLNDGIADAVMAVLSLCREQPRCGEAYVPPSSPLKSPPFHFAPSKFAISLFSRM